MGFFLDDEVAEKEMAKAKPAPVRRKAGRSFDPKAVGCDNCPLQDIWNTLLSSRMPMAGSRDADILMLGEGPGEQEDKQGEPFVGPSGKLLRGLIPRRYRDRIAYQNMVRCRPPDNRAPTPHEVHACSPYLRQDFDDLPNLKVIVGIGGIALSRQIADAPITKMHGVRMPALAGDRPVWFYPILHPSFILQNGDDRSPAYPIFESDMRDLFKGIDRWGKPRICKLSEADVALPETYEAARDALAQMRDPIAIDFETSRLRPYEEGAVLLTAALSDGETTIAFPVDHPEGPTDWGWKLVEEVVTQHLWMPHSASMELSWIWYRMGPDWVPTPYEDTMAIGRIYHKREILSLGNLSRIHLGVDVKQLSEVNPKHIMDYPLSSILPYNGLDSLATALIYDRIHDKVDRWQVEKLYGSSLATTAMELRGLTVDLSVTRDLEKQYSATMEAARAAAADLYEVKEFERAKGASFNIASGEHVGTALVEYGRCKLPKTAGAKGIYSTEDGQLEKLAESNPLAKQVRLYREPSKLVSTYLTNILNGDLIAPDGLLHPGYTTAHTATLRLSSEHPNIQNFPKRKHREIRRQIVAPRGHVLVPIDFGQLEARVIAMASRDRRLCEAIISGYDIHSDWRDRLLDMFPPYYDHLIEASGQHEEKKVLKAGRDQIKNEFVFASLFGASAKTCALHTGVPIEYMEDLQADFWGEFKGVAKWLKGQRSLYRSTGSVFTLTGRERHSIMWGNEPINTPIQGTAADIVQEAQNELAALSLREKDPYLMPRINIHDDLTFILPDNDAKLDEYIDIATKAMVKLRHDFMIVPLMVEVQIGYNWCDTAEILKVTGKHHR